MYMINANLGFLHDSSNQSSVCLIGAKVSHSVDEVVQEVVHYIGHVGLQISWYVGSKIIVN